VSEATPPEPNVVSCVPFAFRRSASNDCPTLALSPATRIFPVERTVTACARSIALNCALPPVPNDVSALPSAL